MSFDKIFDLTAGVYFNFNNNTTRGCPSLAAYRLAPGVMPHMRSVTDSI